MDQYFTGALAAEYEFDTTRFNRAEYISAVIYLDIILKIDLCGPCLHEASRPNGTFIEALKEVVRLFMKIWRRPRKRPNN